tara:strand:- start:3406 stop:4452 length:1047 start_codon:yes stop_codon:yes gene_type:complete
MKTRKDLTIKLDTLFEKCNYLALKTPWMVVVVLHELWRSLYPADPYLKFYAEELSHSERIYNLVDKLIIMLNSVDECIYNYPFNFSVSKPFEVKEETARVYSNLWKNLSLEEKTDNTRNIIIERWKANNINPDLVKGKSVIDVGCGSGRHSFALSKLGANHVTAVDFGDEGLNIGRNLAEQLNINNISFRKVDVLEMPFKNESFDFVFCNGVLHHTTNIEKGIQELIRVCKKGSPIYLYLYGCGGIFWYSFNEMRKIMKQIPLAYSQQVLDSIACPRDRWGLIDDWYVRIATQSSDCEIRNILESLNVKKIFKLTTGRKTDLEFYANNMGEEGKTIWGEGELRYLIHK